MPYNKNIKIIFKNTVAVAVFLLLSYFIYLQIVRQPNWRGSLDTVLAAIHGPRQWQLWLVVLLMPLNWGIEARKWQLALRPIGGIPFKDAFRAIFTGTTMASFTPNRMGEYLGRLLYVREGRRIQSISLTIVGSIAQLLTTMVMGLTGILYMRWQYFHGGLSSVGFSGASPIFWLHTLLWVVSVLTASLTIIYFRLSWVVWTLGKIPFAGRWVVFLKEIESFDASILLRILFLSFGRYLVFMAQYCLVFPVFGVMLTVGQAWAGVSVVFLVMAIVPTITFLTELGLRWGASIRILELFSVNTVGIFAASFAIWLINLIIPALIGSLLILSIKLFKRE